MKKVLFIGLAVFIIGGIFSAGFTLFFAYKDREIDVSRESPPVVGGGCTYKENRGECTITEIVRRGYSIEEQDDGFLVHYAFDPAEKNSETLGIAKKPYTLEFPSGTLPGPLFLETYGITIGSRHVCKVDVIQSGTCSPVVPRFDAIDTNDYYLKLKELKNYRADASLQYINTLMDALRRYFSDKRYPEHREAILVGEKNSLYLTDKGFTETDEGSGKTYFGPLEYPKPPSVLYDLDPWAEYKCDGIDCESYQIRFVTETPLKDIPIEFRDRTNVYRASPGGIRGETQVERSERF